MKSLSTLFRHSATVASLLAASTVTVGLIAPSASALSLVPQEEGEVELLNIDDLGGLVGPAVTLPDLIASVKSLANPDGTFSRLFVDDLSTANDYGIVQLQAGDIGTVPPGFWYRPSEVEEENGQLEVGTFKFMFTETLPELTVRYFDTESSNTTGVPDFFADADTDGTLLFGENPVPAGENANIYTQTWENVSFITLKLGKDTAGTGDGVDFQLETVPEPGTVLGLGALAMAGAFGLRKRNKKA
ncbi:PEP-CTERM putative exosortase interaction domain protein [Coleofasciculus chthonoplastes PCC 7420]|uniref:PEP-CTERM putative exosortase interaction domain protein n=1 Tax=Coleofasciculus chthonoplastes PCC 7420 TaxID=118168 RepID=B4W352_9CYAN|nr:LEVG family PEP-CTERM protein [Coleofasciculus chthonoplastes]EDX71383.1 PEP-CTERM putative exosortase interaction domain protein [Coleofasciculus chthonoplastes PCC 7420]